MSGTLELQDLGEEHVTKVVEIHLEAFQKFFLSFLGRRFLRLYYQSIIEFGQIGFVALQEQSLVGFVVGIDNGFGFYQKLFHWCGVRFALTAIPAFIKRPTILPRLMRALWKRTPQVADNLPMTTLTSIAVLPGIQRRGVGHALITRYKEAAKDHGFAGIILDTDADDNDTVCRFYEREGFRVNRFYVTPEGRRMYQYSYNIQGETPTPDDRAGSFR